MHISIFGPMVVVSTMKLPPSWKLDYTRFQPGRGSMSLGKSQGGLPPDEFEENKDDIMKDCRRLIETYHDTSKYFMLRIALAPCSPFSVTKELMIKSAKLDWLVKTNKSLYICIWQKIPTTLTSRSQNYGERPWEFIASIEWDRSDLLVCPRSAT